MFDRVQLAPPDAILGLSAAFHEDVNPDKINLAVGVFKDADGRTPVLEAVKAAEARLLETQSSKSYLPIEGAADYAAAVRGLLLGADHPIEQAGRARTAHTPGGTGALRVAGDYLQQNHRGTTVWVSDPTWANHHGVFHAAGLGTATYRYFDASANGLDLEGMLEDLDQAPRDDVVLLHGACHNPTGIDPDPEQWLTIAQHCKARGLLPLIDFAYQGFGEDLESDAAGLRTVCDTCGELLICSSFSKNFGLYCERAGALTAVAGSSDAAQAVMSQIKQAIRRNYSNPPAHGAAIVSAILNAPALRRQWVGELAAMRERIHRLRDHFTQALDAAGVSLSASGNDFVRRQRGMFTMTGLTRQHVEALRKRHAIYVVGSGRINVAGMSEQAVPRLAAAIKDVTQRETAV